MEQNIHPIFDNALDRNQKETLLNQKSLVVWMVGLSGAGKSTIAKAMEKELHNKGYLTQILDGDNLRMGINNNLSFSQADRVENIRRTAEVAKLFMNCGVITICSFISPTNEIRTMAKEIIGVGDYFEVFVNCPLSICEERDVKGLYKKARNGEISDFTGVDSPFEPPENPSIEIRTDVHGIVECRDFVLTKIYEKIKFNF